jgi:hypothetical protein
MVATCSGGTGGFTGGGGGGGVVVSTCTTGGGATGGGGGGFLQLIATTNEARMINSTKCFTFTGTSLGILFNFQIIGSISGKTKDNYPLCLSLGPSPSLLMNSIKYYQLRILYEFALGKSTPIRTFFGGMLLRWPGRQISEEILPT